MLFIVGVDRIRDMHATNDNCFDYAAAGSIIWCRITPLDKIGDDPLILYLFIQVIEFKG